MNSVMICEGSTDFSLLQYYMRKVYLWEDDKEKQTNVLKIEGKKSRLFTKGEDTLTIMSVGGCSRLIEGLQKVLNRNKLSSPDLQGVYRKVVIITDRDEIDTEAAFLGLVSSELVNFGVTCHSVMENNCWLNCEMTNLVGQKLEFRILLMVIPFGENGAMETFLLKSIAADDEYDKIIIQECDKLVDSVDPEKKYLTGRRMITKAKFDTYFSIRTPAEQFVERQNILKSVDWENYSSIQRDFALLGDL